MTTPHQLDMKLENSYELMRGRIALLITYCASSRTPLTEGRCMCSSVKSISLSRQVIETDKLHRGLVASQPPGSGQTLLPPQSSILS